MAYEFLLCEKRDKTALVTLNRPDKRNALSIALRNEIDHCLGELADDDSVSVVVLAGAGPSFCAGFDRNEFFIQTPEHVEALIESTDRFHLRLMNFPKPLVAAINGPAMGGGLDLAVLCDVRICAQDAVFAHPEIKFGAPTLYGPLAEVIGGGLARDLCLTGRRIDAQEAHRIGLVSSVVPLDRLLEEAVAVANSIAEAPLAGLKTVKQMIIDRYCWRYVTGEDIFASLRPPGSQA
ncbi:MAG: enoyl-CoA hydratase/isomerase family protein [Chloroflexota bacterium]|nr:enoyl-CoA hydratase/isomerase family protein [Chloroflexota bacterium]